MCRIFNSIYACGHRDVIKAPCEWRDEGRINIFGKRIPCENSTRNLADLTRHCMTCSPDPARQDLVDLSSSCAERDVESLISSDENDIMATIVRNESHLRKRAKMSCVTPTPATSLGFLTTSELQYRYCVNEEFLARRLKRRYLQEHLGYRGDYQDFLEAAQAHLNARAALNSSVFSIQESLQATDSTGDGQGAARTPTVDSSTQTDEIEEAMVYPSHPSPPSLSASEDSSGTITASRPRTRRGLFPTISPELEDSSTTIRPWHPRAPSPQSLQVSSESENSAEWATGSRPFITSSRRVRQAHNDLQYVMGLDIDNKKSGLIESCEGGESSGLIEPDNGEAHEQENRRQDPFAEWSGFVGGLSNEWAERGRSRPNPPQTKVPLDSLEGITGLADIRVFLGMRPDTKPSDIWNFATRNNDLIENITASTLLIRHRHLGQAKRPGFDRDPGLDTVSDFADDKLELRKGFADVWNSLDWALEALSGPGPDVPRPPTDENNSGDNESTIDELYRVLNVEDFIAEGVNIDDLNIEDDVEQGETKEQENEDEQKTFPLEGRCTRIPYEVDFGGRSRAPSHQARNASRLRMSWTYADLENPASSPGSQDEPVSPLPSLLTSSASQDEPMSPPSPPQTSHDVSDSPLYSHSFSSLSLPLDPGSPLFMDDGSPSIEPEDTTPWAPSQEGPELPSASDHSGSISPRIFERKPSSTLIQADSTKGKRLLSDVRRFLAMPDSKTPQEISLFIDLHPELMKAIRTRYVPPRKLPMNLSKKKLRQRKTQEIFNPLRTLRAQNNRRHRFMQANLAMALKVLDWDEIDSAPTPLTLLSSWDEGFVAAAERHQIDDSSEEECDNWMRTTVSPKYNRLIKIDKYLIKHQVKKPTPLRTMLTRQEVEEEISPTQVEPEEGIATTRNGPKERRNHAQSNPEGEITTTPSQPETWEDVDLGVGF